MTTKQIQTVISKTQNQVNTISKLTGAEGNILINIKIKEKDYSAFEAVQNEIENKVVISENSINIQLFYIWIK